MKISGLLNFCGITVHMLQLLHGQIGTSTRIACANMGIRILRTTWFIRTCCQKKASLSCSMASGVVRNIRSGHPRPSTFLRRRLSVITALSSPQILNERPVSVRCAWSYHHLCLPHPRPRGDWGTRTLQSTGQGHSGVIEGGKVVGYLSGFRRTIPGAGLLYMLNPR